MARKSSDAIPNDALYNLRDARGETQQDVADALIRLARSRGVSIGPTANHVSRWERGIVRPAGVYRQLLAEHFGVSLTELGLTRQRVVASSFPDNVAGLDGDSFLIESAPFEESDPHVTANQSSWRAVRRTLNTERVALARAASELYRPTQRLSSTGLLVGDRWIMDAPIDLGKIGLEYVQHAPDPIVTGAEEESASCRPLRDMNRRYTRYSLAVHDIDRPRLFENRTAWRLLGSELSSHGGTLRLADTTYFDAIDVCEALAHETAASLLTAPAGKVGPSSWRGLHLRKLIGDPFDGGRRVILPSTDTLTIRRDRDGSSFVLHNRNAGNVGTAGGMLHIMPAGVFQPSSVRAVARTADFHLWRNIMREYSEEFLGNPEHGGAGQAIDYQAEPFRAFEDARAAGALRVFCLGVALDALTLWGEILTVAVFDGEVYDRIFMEMVQHNEEGGVVRTGRVHSTSAIPFTANIVRELLDGGRLAPAAAGCIQLAWQHRRQLLEN